MNPELYDNVRMQIPDYQHKGYGHEIIEDELRNSDPRHVWYLPPGVVQNAKKPGKVRLVLDAAVKIEGTSFNSMVQEGPDFSIPITLLSSSNIVVKPAVERIESFEKFTEMLP